MSEQEEPEVSGEGRRLKIEGDLPIRAAGIETQRERKNYSDLPPQNYIHVWWARRPTPATRLGLLSSVLPDSVDDDQLLRWMGMDPNNKDPDISVAEHVRQKQATKDERSGFVYEHFGYRKAYKNLPDEKEMEKLHDLARETWGGELPTVLDATAGGGSIPFESVRYEFPTMANELNPVASVILKAVLEHPRVNGDLSDDIRKWGEEINERAREELEEYFPASEDGREPLTYLWAHTITCPDCGIELPLSPNWWIDRDNDVAARPKVDDNEVTFEIIDVSNEEYNPSSGTVSRGKGECLNCKVTISGDKVKEQAQSGEMGYFLYCVEYRDQYDDTRGNFRPATKRDLEAFHAVKDVVCDDFELSTLLTEDRFVGPADRSANYGISKWRDMYFPRQLLVHHTYWRKFEEIKKEVRDNYNDAETNVLLTFLALANDKVLDYNNRLSSWDNTVPKVRNSFERHDFAFKWSFTEINQAGENIGYEWCLSNVLTAYDDLRDLAGNSSSSIRVSQEDAANLSIDDSEVDAIVLDPPYYDNVMYAELSDFFYVWLKKYLGDVYPEFFERELTDKDDEAVANESKFDDVAGEGKSKSEMAKEDYERKMTEIFEEMHRVLEDNGVFTLMFTHKKTEAWDTLTKALIESGFTVNATHPISTENPNSLHQAGKNAAESTILLSSRKRSKPAEDAEYTLWSDVKRKTREAAMEKAQELDEREVEFTKVDMILASFGPTLQVFTQNYPVIDDEGNEIRPQKALDEARNAVRDYLIDEYLNQGVREADPKTEWYVLAWLVFEAERFPYDEARRLAIGLGEEIDGLKKTNRMWRKKSDDIVLRSHDERVQTPQDKQKSRTVKPIDPDDVAYETDLDKVHAVLYVYDTEGSVAAHDYIKERGFENDTAFKATLEALIHVLPQNHDDWEIARDLSVGDTGRLLDLDIDRSAFGNNDEKEVEQSKVSEYE